jgi:peptide/nickel transport system permease protein
VTRYLLTRVGLVVPTLLGVTLVVTVAVRLLPGDVIDQILGPDAVYVNPETRAALERRFALDRSIFEQYGNWVIDLARGDLGRSLISGRPIASELAGRIPATVQLGTMGLAFALAIALPVGILSAVYRDRPIDYLGRSLAILLLAAPSFWLRLLAITYGFILFRWTPPLRYHELWENPGANLNTMWIPALILGAHVSGRLMRLTRTTVLEVLGEDYVRTARAKGLRERAVILSHALPNALIPVVTEFGLQVRLLIGGTVVLERIFSIPGMGNYLLTSIQQRDYPVVQAIVLLTGVVVVLSNLVVDLLYSVLDPRVRYG